MNFMLTVKHPHPLVITAKQSPATPHMGGKVYSLALMRD